jgi:FlaA1/EpsC-like NDP-sugar epimerase
METGVQLLPGWLLVQGTSLFILRVPVQFWKFFGFRDLRRLALAVALGVIACAPFTLIAVGPADGVRVLLVDGLLALAALMILRAVRRARYEAEIPGHATPILVAGSSDRVEPLIREMLRSRTIGLRPLAVFCPGEIESVRNLCHDVPVFSSYGELSESSCFDRIEEIHVVGDPAELPQGTDLLLAAKHRDLRVRTVPAVWASRDWRARRASEADTQGVLTRKPIVTDLRRLRAVYRGSTVLVTGGAGSIGSQIVRSLAEAGAARIVALDLSENGLCYLAEEMRSTHPETVFHSVVGNILDAGRLEEVVFGEKPDFVFHAAARKHVNFMETAADEAVRVNVEGTYRVALAARDAGARTCVLISTDKAVDPTSVMGATKLLAERVLRLVAAEGSTRFAAVRFGNVLG